MKLTLSVAVAAAVMMLGAGLANANVSSNVAGLHLQSSQAQTVNYKHHRHCWWSHHHRHCK
jgi:hypothetical protein